MTTTTAVGNRKGGVGKSTVTVLLAGALARKGRRVLIIDLDEQRSASSTVGGKGEHDILDVLSRKEPVPLSTAIVASNWDGIDVVPGSSEITYLDSDPDGMKVFRLQKALEREPDVVARYDDILIDTPPSLGACTVVGLLAADLVIAVAQPERFSNIGIGEFIDALVEIRDVRPNIRFHGVLVNGLKAQLKGHQMRLSELSEALGDEVILSPMVPHKAAIIEAMSEAVPMHLVRRPDTKDVIDIFDKHADLLIAKGDEH